MSIALLTPASAPPISASHEEGVFVMSTLNVSRLIEEQNSELLPSKPENRTLTMPDLAVLCAGMVVNIVGLVIPAEVYLAGGVSGDAVLFSALLGFLLVTALITLTGDIGTRYGVPFTVFIRDCLGKKGALLGSAFRAVVCMTWTGVIFYFGSMAINTLMETWLGVSAFWAVFAIFAGLQLWNASRNVKSMSRFGWLAMPALALALITLVAWVLKTQQITLAEAIAAAPRPGGGFALHTAIAVFAGGWLSEALNGSDLSRRLIQGDAMQGSGFLARNRRMLMGFFIGFVGTGVLLSGAGIVTCAVTNTTDPVGMIKTAFADSPLVLSASCLIIVAAQWSTNTAANIFPATLILLNAAPRLSFAGATWVIGLVSCSIMPIVLTFNLAYVQMVFSAMLAPLLAVMLVHYYGILKGRLNVGRLYDGSLPDWNRQGVAALALGLAAGFMFRDMAFFAAFPVSAAAYYALTRRAVSRNGDGRHSNENPL